MPILYYGPGLDVSLLFDVLAFTRFDFHLTKLDDCDCQGVEVHGDGVFQLVGPHLHRFERRGSFNYHGQATGRGRICDGPVVSRRADIATGWLQHDK